MAVSEAEFRGTDNLWVVPITKDDSTGYTFGTPVNLTPSGQISKTVNSSSETHWYSNVGMITIVTKGSDTVTVTTPVLSLEKIALLTGQTYDETTGALVTGDLAEKYFALIYRVQLTDDTWRYVIKYKAMLSAAPEEVSSTRSDGVDTNGQQLEFTCNKTVYAFANGGHVDGIELDERDNYCDFSSFFSTVYTPDTIDSIAVSTATALSISADSASVVVGDTTSVTATTTPADARVVFTTSNPNVATVSNATSNHVGAITGVGAGTAVITATSGSYSAPCTVTVQEE